MLGGRLPGRQTTPARADTRAVATRKAKRSRTTDPLASYRRIRKPMPPPEKVIEDKRRKMEEELAEREIQERDP